MPMYLLMKKIYAYWLEHSSIQFSSFISILDQDQEIFCQLFSLQTVGF